MKTKFIPNGKLIPTIWGIYIQDGKTKFYFEKKDTEFLYNLALKYCYGEISVNDTLEEIHNYFDVNVGDEKEEVIMNKFYKYVTTI